MRIKISEIDVSPENIKVITPEELKVQGEKREETNKYIKQPDGSSYKCRDCGTEIKATYHPVWNSPFPKSGTGQVTSGIPYCPKCEEEPDINRLPVAPKGSYHNP
ncbi:MAG: hypothetical protein KJI71_03190 [Patescibacteria group bacterium]|nr:hypothetical protein [Patescibacteria group bacterium]